MPTMLNSVEESKTKQLAKTIKEYITKLEPMRIKTIARTFFI